MKRNAFLFGAACLALSGCYVNGATGYYSSDPDRFEASAIHRPFDQYINDGRVPHGRDITYGDVTERDLYASSNHLEPGKPGRDDGRYAPRPETDNGVVTRRVSTGSGKECITGRDGRTYTMTTSGFRSYGDC